MPDPPTPSRHRWLRRLLLGTVGVLLLGVAFTSWLFSGSDADCRPLPGPALVCTLDVAASPQAVWDAYTETDEAKPYFFDAILEAELAPGGSWRFLTDDRRRFLAGGEVISVEPPHRFVHTFAAADLTDAPSRVTVQIAATLTGSRVVLTHDEFTGQTETWRRFRKAHPLSLGALGRYVENGRVPWRTRAYTAIFKPGMKWFGVPAPPSDGDQNR